MANKKLSAATLADLKRSGLTCADAMNLGIRDGQFKISGAKDKQALVPMEEATSTGWANDTEVYAGYYLPYFGLDGSPLDGFWRFRFTCDPLPVVNAEVRKYTQPGGKPPRFYLSPLVKWKKFAGDSKAALYIVEGEKKGAALARLGVPAIGLGGVWNWRTHERAIDDFERVEWRNRKVYIVFDSDIRYKKNVQDALRALRDELIARGADPYEKLLPDDIKGVDDFLVAHGSHARAKKAFLALPARSLLVPVTSTFAEIAAKNLPEPTYVVPGILATGLTVFVGPPKIGKSWAMLQTCLGVAAGKPVFGGTPKPAGVLYLALEDTERRFKSRQQKMLAGAAAPANAHFAYQWPRVEENGLVALERWLDAHKEVKLVVIDTLARFRPRRTKNSGSMYENDYSDLEPLKRIADACGIALVVVHHTRKMRSDDWIEDVSGSMGLTGAADTIIRLKRARSQADATLSITGRDVQELDLALQQDPKTMHWKVLGPAAEHQKSKERQQITDTLKRLRDLGVEHYPATPSEVAAANGGKRDNVKKLMLAMLNDNELTQPEVGKYALPEEGGGRAKY